jgi:hypothetical protein
VTDLRKQTALDLMHARSCYKNLDAVLPTFEREERARIQAAMDQFKEEIKRSAERMLQFAANGHSN